jgi:LacI family transcriptional regulator
MSQQGGAQAITEMLKLPRRPDAVFGSNDLAAAGAMQVIKAHGLRVPHDVAVAGFSNEAFATLTEPNLTSVDQGCETMGISAVRLLQKMLNPDPNRLMQTSNVVLKPRLLVRESSRRR